LSNYLTVIERKTTKIQINIAFVRLIFPSDSNKLMQNFDIFIFFHFLLSLSKFWSEIASWMFSEKKNFRGHCCSWALPPTHSIFENASSRFWQVAPIRGSIDLKRGLDVGRCVTCCEPTFKQARPDSTRARGLRLAWREPECFVPSSTGGEETPRRVPWLESKKRVKPGARVSSWEAAEFHTLYTFYIAFDYARSRWLRAAREFAQLARPAGE